MIFAVSCCHDTVTCTWQSDCYEAAVVDDEDDEEDDDDDEAMQNSITMAEADLGAEFTRSSSSATEVGGWSFTDRLR